VTCIEFISAVRKVNSQSSSAQLQNTRVTKNGDVLYSSFLSNLKYSTKTHVVSNQFAHLHTVPFIAVMLRVILGQIRASNEGLFAKPDSDSLHAATR